MNDCGLACRDNQSNPALHPLLIARTEEELPPESIVSAPAE
jgi:hypothetical protein